MRIKFTVWGKDLYFKDSSYNVEVKCSKKDYSTEYYYDDVKTIPESPVKYLKQKNALKTQL